MANQIKPYRQMLLNLTAQLAMGRTMLLKMGLYRAYASLRDYANPMKNVEPPDVQSKARSTAEANGLSMAFWLAKSADHTVDARTVVEDTSKLVEGVIDLAPQPRAYACRSGCYFCCYEAVTVSELEATAIARHIQSLPEAEQRAYITRLEEYVEKVRDDPRPKKQVPCAFLNRESGACSIYAVRPFMCRALTSYDVTPCQTDDQLYQVDYIRYGAYTAAFVGASHADLPNHMAVMKLPQDKQRTGENLAVAVLKQLAANSTKG